MEVGGWRRADFESDADFLEWVQSRPSLVDFSLRKAHMGTAHN